MPLDLGGRVFPVSGGLPLAKRAPQRQAYRLIELERFARWLQLPIHLHPRFFPVQGDDAARLIIAVDQHDGADAAMALAGAVLSACWAEELNISDEATLARLLERCGLPPQRIEDGHSQAAQLRYEADTQRAVDAGVFGAPSYVVDGELFWGQDRLDFLERRLRA
jgi:carboxymethylenebutenolidase